MRDDHDRQLAHGVSLLDDEALKQNQPVVDLDTQKAFLDAIAFLGAHLYGERRWQGGRFGLCLGRRSEAIQQYAESPDNLPTSTTRRAGSCASSALLRKRRAGSGLSHRRRNTANVRFH